MTLPCRPWLSRLAVIVLVLCTATTRAAQPELDRLVADLRGSDPEKRVEALEALLDLGPTAGPIVQELVPLLGQLEADDRLLLIELLGEIGPDAAPAVGQLSTLLKSDEPLVAEQAMLALGRIGGAAKPALAELDRLAAGQERFTAVLAIRAGAQIRRALGDDSHLAADRGRLVELLADADPRVRTEALESLASLGPGSLADLMRYAQSADAATVAQVTEILAGWGDSAEPAVNWLEELLANASPELRRAGATALERLGSAGHASAGTLAKLLADSDASVRASAAAALGEVAPPGDAAASEALIDRLSDSDERVRLAVVDALGRWARRKPPLLARLLAALSDADPGVAATAVEHLSTLGDAATEGLIAALDDSRARPWAAVLLGELGPPAAPAAPALIKAASDPRPEVRREVLITLGQLGPAAAQAVPTLIAALGDADLTVRYAAAGGLGLLGPAAADADQPLKKLHAETDDPFLKTLAVWARARMHPQDKALEREAVAGLIDSIQHGPPRLRIGAARALAELKADPEVVLPALSAALTDADPMLVGNAVEALADLGPRVVPRARLALGVEGLRLPALAILQRLGPAAAPAAADVAKLLSIPEPRLRQQALMTLGAMGPAAAAQVSAIAGQLADADVEVRRSAGYALGLVGPEALSAVPGLKKLLGDGDELTRLVAAWALLHVHGSDPPTVKAAVPVLEPGLHQAQPAVRGEALAALAKADPNLLAPFGELRKEVEELERSDADQAVREQAARLLEHWK